MLVVLDRTDLATGLVTEVSVDRTVLCDPCLGQDSRTESGNHGNMSTTARGLLGQNDIADLESTVGLVTGPLVGDVREVASRTLLSE